MFESLLHREFTRLIFLFFYRVHIHRTGVAAVDTIQIGSLLRIGREEKEKYGYDEKRPNGLSGGVECVRM